MKQIKNFINEKLALNKQSIITSLTDADKTEIEKIIKNFKQLQREHKLKSFYDQFDWDRVNEIDFKESSPEDIKKVFYARTTKDKEEANRTLILYKDKSKNYYPWQEASIGKKLFKIGNQKYFSKWGPDNLPYGPTFDSSTKEKYEFVKNRESYIIQLPLK